MEELINVLLKNPFLILLIVGGLFSLFRGKGDQGKEEERQQVPRQQRTEQQRKRPESISDTIRKTMESLEQEVKKSKPEQEKPIQTISVEEHREKQLQRLSNQIARKTSMNKEDISKPFSQPEHEAKSNDVPINSHDEFKKHFKENLTREGLTQSVIMAEVLGLPRSRQPYQSVVANRRKR